MASCTLDSAVSLASMTVTSRAVGYLATVILQELSADALSSGISIRLLKQTNQIPSLIYCQLVSLTGLLAVYTSRYCNRDILCILFYIKCMLHCFHTNIIHAKVYYECVCMYVCMLVTSSHLKGWTDLDEIWCEGS